MIKCPRCGADAQWGARQCPRCLAPFVPPPPGVVPPGFQQPQSQVPRKSTGAFVGIVLFVAVSAGSLWWAERGRTRAGAPTMESRKQGSTPQGGGSGSGALEAFAVAPDSSPDVEVNGNEPHQEGIFAVRAQPGQPPVIAIGNGTGFDLCLQLQDEKGSVQTEWIPAGGERDLRVTQGYYQAAIDTPDDFSVRSPTYGTVDVKDFHHYEASFFDVPATDTPESFHIGD